MRRISDFACGRLCTTFALIGVISFGLAQPNSKNFESILVSDGLAQSAVSDILRDQYGYVWFGTRSGLSRYDGTEFVNYLHDPNDSTTLSHNAVWSLYDSQDGKLWIGTFDGLNAYDWATETFVRYKHPDLENNQINRIQHWAPDTLIMSTMNGFFFCNIVDGSIFRLPEFERFDDQLVTFTMKPGGDLLVGTNDELLLFENNDFFSLPIQNAKSIYIDINKNIWTVNHKDVYIITPDFTRFRKLESVLPIYNGRGAIAEDGTGRVIVAKGLVSVYNLDGELVDHYSHDPSQLNTLLHNSVTCIEIDSDGIWWIGTNGYGANKFDPNRPSIAKLGHNPGVSPSLSIGYVTSFYTKDDLDVFIGTSISLDVYNSESLAVSKLSDDRIDILYEDGDRLWAASEDYMILVDPKKKKIVKKYYVENLYSARDIKKDRDGNLLVVCGSGMYKFNPTDGSYQKLIDLDHSIRKPSTDWLTALHKQDSNYLVGTSVGLYKFNPTSKKFGRCTIESLSSIANSNIKCIQQDRAGNIWIGTWGSGLFHWNVATDEVRQYTRVDGLPDDVIYGVLEDSRGYLWMSTNKGLSRFNPKNEEFVNLDVSYGLQSNEFNTSAYFKSENGKFYFGGVSGLNFFFPEGIENPTLSETLITGFYLNNQRVAPSAIGKNPKAIMDTDTIILAHTQNMIGLDFKGSNFTVSELNQYAYYLENLEEDWNYVGNRRFANYSSLPSGTYIFKVKSSNNNGLWDETPASLVVIIDEPYWQSAWFRFLIVMVFITAGVVFYRWRIYTLKRTERRLRTVVGERTQELRKANKSLRDTNKDLEQSIEELNKTQQQLIQNEKMASLGVLSAGMAHEINNPLNFIKNGIHALEGKIVELNHNQSEHLKTYFDIINEGSDRIYRIVKSLGHFSYSGSSNRDQCNIHAILDNCLLILNSNLKYRITVTKQYHPDAPTIEGNEGRLHQAFLNILSNSEQAIGDEGNITLRTGFDDNRLFVTISDSGKGISEENLHRIKDPFFTTKSPGEGTGLGLSITHAIVDEHGGYIDISSEVGIGSSVTITLPLKQNQVLLSN